MSYVDVYTLEDYQERVQNISSMASALNSEAEVDKRENRLMQQIEILEAKEQQIFNILHVKSTQELNQRIQQYRAAVFNLSGPQLSKYFTEIMDQRNQERGRFFQEDVQKIIADSLAQFGNNYASLGKDGVIGIIGPMLQSVSGSKIKVSKGFTSEGVFPSKFTKRQKEEWQKLIQAAKDPKGFKYSVDGKDIKVTLGEHTNTSFSALFDWEQETNGYTKSWAQKEFSQNQAELQEINNKIKNYIVSCVSPSGQSIVLDIINNKVLAKDPYAFFVGKNVNEITGLLGEIQGLYYLHVLTGGQANIEWVGGIARNGKKPHQDIILNEHFGIQVKNTTKDALKQTMTVGFQSATLDYFLSQLHIDSYAKNLLENFYGTLMFNVPYHIESNGTYASGIGEKSERGKSFLMSYAQLKATTDEIDSFLEGFAASFMYLDVETEALRLYDGNSLFLLGGAMITTASEILTEILGELRTKKHNFRVRASFSDVRNIIEALNDHSRAPNYSGDVLSKVVLSTSFTF